MNLVNQSINPSVNHLVDATTLGLQGHWHITRLPTEVFFQVMTAVSISLAPPGEIQPPSPAAGRMSLARAVVLVALAIQVIAIAHAIFLQVGLAHWMDLVKAGDGPAIAGIVVFLGSLGLVYPVMRGGRWPLAVTIVLLALLLPPGLPLFAFQYSRPAALDMWMVLTSAVLSAFVGIGFGVMALLEGFGRIPASAFRTANGAVSRSGALAVALGAALLGMVVLAAAVAQTPADKSATAVEPDLAVLMPMNGTRFTVNSVNVNAGQTTALVMANHDSVVHSFDVDSLNIHVSVPAGATSLAFVTPTDSGSIPSTAPCQATKRRAWSAQSSSNNWKGT